MLPNRRSPPPPHGISKRTMCRPTRLQFRGRLIRLGEMSEDDAQPLHRGTGGSAYTRKARATREAPERGQGWSNRTPARDRLGAHGVAERFVVPRKPGNSGGGKGPQFKTDAERGEGHGDWETSHGELWVKSVFIRACVKLRGLFRYPRSEPDCMTRPVSEHDQPHIRSPLETAVPTSRLRRAGAQGTKPFYQSACRAMVTIGSSTRIRQN